MKKILTLFIALALFAPYSVTGSGARPRSKPLAPLKIEIITSNNSVSTQNILGGDIVDLQVVVSSFTDFKNALVSITLTKELELISGVLGWEGPLQSGEKKVIPITVRIPEIKKGKIKAKVLAPVSEGTSFSATAKFNLSGKKEKPIQPPVKKDGKGRDIIEYRL